MSRIICTHILKNREGIDVPLKFIVGYDHGLTTYFISIYDCRDRLIFNAFNFTDNVSLQTMMRKLKLNLDAPNETNLSDDLPILEGPIAKLECNLEDVTSLMKLLTDIKRLKLFRRQFSEGYYVLYDIRLDAINSLKEIKTNISFSSEGRKV